VAEGRQGGFYLNPTDEDLSVGAEVVKKLLEFIGPPCGSPQLLLPFRTSRFRLQPERLAPWCALPGRLVPVRQAGHCPVFALQVSNL
jgi:hypothetical protein